MVSSMWICLRQNAGADAILMIGGVGAWGRSGVPCSQAHRQHARSMHSQASAAVVSTAPSESTNLATHAIIIPHSTW